MGDRLRNEEDILAFLSGEKNSGKKIQRIQFPVLEKSENEPDPEPESISKLGDLPFNIVAELGRTGITLRHFLSLQEGDIIELSKPAGDMADIFVNDRYLGQGEVLVVNNVFSVRLALASDRKDFTEKEES